MCLNVAIKEAVDVNIQKDANAWASGGLNLREWRERWGHLNPLAYCTLPVSQIDARKYRMPPD